jgi:hypothetical protein
LFDEWYFFLKHTFKKDCPRLSPKRGLGHGCGAVKIERKCEDQGSCFFLFGDEDFVFTFKSQYYAHWLHMGEDAFASKLGYSFGSLYFWIREGGGISHSFQNQM